MRYDSKSLVPATTSRTISPALPLSQVAEVRFLYKTIRRNLYTVHYGAATPGQCKAVEFSAPAYNVGEKGTSASIGVRRVGDLTGPLTVQFHTEDGSATAPDDYGSVDRALTFAPGATTATVTVPIVDDPDPNPPRTVRLFLTHPDPDPNPRCAGAAQHGAPHHHGR